jgi:hypothetical protein
METRIFTIGKLFYDDHLQRECGAGGTIIKTTKTTYTVELNLEAYNDLLSDCDYYWECRDEFIDICGGQLSAAARRTMKKLMQ